MNDYTELPRALPQTLSAEERYVLRGYAPGVMGALGIRALAWIDAATALIAEQAAMLVLDVDRVRDLEAARDDARREYEIAAKSYQQACAELNGAEQAEHDAVEARKHWEQQHGVQWERAEAAEQKLAAAERVHAIDQERIDAAEARVRELEAEVSALDAAHRHVLNQRNDAQDGLALTEAKLAAANGRADCPDISRTAAPSFMCAPGQPGYCDGCSICQPAAQCACEHPENAGTHGATMCEIDDDQPAAPASTGMRGCGVTHERGHCGWCKRDGQPAAPARHPMAGTELNQYDQPAAPSRTEAEQAVLEACREWILKRSPRLADGSYTTSWGDDGLARVINAELARRGLK